MSDVFWGEKFNNRDIITILGFSILGITVISQYINNFNKNKK